MNDEQLLLKYIEDIIAEILGQVGLTDWANDDLRDPAILRIQNIISQYGFTIGQVLPPSIVTAYFGSIDEATKAMIAAGLDISPTLALTPDGLIAKPFQQLIHLQAVEKLIDDAMLDIAGAVEMSTMYSRQTIEQTVADVKAEMVKGLIRGDARKVTQARVMDAFRDHGLTAFTVEDKRGRLVRLPLDFYSMTVVRSKTRDAQVQGSANRYTEAGQDLVIITGNADQCEDCARFRGMVVSLTGKTPGYPVVGQNGVTLPPYHPNCRCGIRVFLRPTAEELRAALKRNSEYNIPGDKRTAAQKAAYDREQEGRRKARAELKQFTRWQDTLGAEAPKNLAAFRRMKRQNTVRFQELQSMYRSARANPNRGPRTK